MASSRTRAAIALTVPILAGVLSGFIASVTFSRAGREEPATVAPSAELQPNVRPEERKMGESDGAGQRRLERAKLERLEQRVLDVESKLNPGDEQAPRPSSAEIAAEAERRHQQSIERHWRAPVDSEWAAKSTLSLQRELKQVGASARFDVVQVDCRTNTCVGVVEWPSYADALSQYDSILMTNYEVNCMRTIHLPQPEEAELPYRASVVFECDDKLAQRE